MHCLLYHVKNVRIWKIYFMVIQWLAQKLYKHKILSKTLTEEVGKK